MSANFDELFDAVMQNYSAVSLQKLYKALQASDNPAEYAELLTMLFESWDMEEAEYDELQANFTIQVLALKAGDSNVFRRALNLAVKKLLPPYLSKPGMIRALGLSDCNVSLHEAMRRFHNLLTVNNNTLAFLSGSSRWGVIRNVDALAGTVAFVPLANGSQNSLSLPTLLGEGTLFMLSTDSQRLAAMANRAMRSGSEYRNVAHNRALSPITDEQIEEIARATYIPNVMSKDDFDAWWSNDGVAAKCNGDGTALRGSCRARSLQEMALLLEKELKMEPKPTFSDAKITAYVEFFRHAKPVLLDCEYKQLGSVMQQLSGVMTPEQLAVVFAPLAEYKCGFLPEDIDGCTLEALVPFGDLNVKALQAMFAILALILPEEYLAKLCSKLPLKAMNVLAEHLSDEVLLPAISDAMSSSDVYMFIWKNRVKRTGKLLDCITIGNVVKVLNQTRMPKAWQAAVRDLKNTLMDKADFQQFLLEAAEKDVKLITSALQAAHVLAAGERQSLLVKFARLDRSMQEHIESGIGRQLVEDAVAADEKPQTVEPLFSSVASIKRLRQELDDIINVHQPENREALKTARAHGDFRENSEFDAAKERRNFLTRRRNELERILLQVQAVNFATTKLDKHAVVGCTVTLQSANGENEVHHLLGAWDGNPDKHYLSYKTRLGEAIYNHAVGSTLDLPGGKRAVLTKIEPLSAEIIAEMDN